MAKKIDYASMFCLRSDGRYQGKWRDAAGALHTTCARDPKVLYERILAKEQDAGRPITFGEIAERWRAIRFDQLAPNRSKRISPFFAALRPDSARPYWETSRPATSAPTYQRLRRRAMPNGRSSCTAT